MEEKEILSPEELQAPQLATLDDTVDVVEEEIENEEDVELSEEELKAMYIKQLKASKTRKPTTSHPTRTVGVETETNALGIRKTTRIKEAITNQTNDKYGSAFKEKRRKKNKTAKAGRRANR